MMPSRIFRTEDLATLYRNKVTIQRQTPTCSMIEYVVRLELTGDRPEKYEVRAAGVNRNGVSFTASVPECTKGRYFFQCDINDTYLQASKNPEQLYRDTMLALAIKNNQ